MDLRQKILGPVKTFNKYILNRFFKLFAGTSPTPFAIVRHVGRRSGTPYETPIIVQPVDDGFVIALTYGPQVDWYRNILAAGQCAIRWHNKEYIIDSFERIDPNQGRSAFAQPFRSLLRLIGPEDFVHMHRRSSAS
jgi:deazaflavin-dependent oxidoreductase (nitroreductase family)